MIDASKTPRCPQCKRDYVFPVDQVQGLCWICNVTDRNDVVAAVDLALDDVFDFVTDSEDGR